MRQCRRNMPSGKRVLSAIKSLFNSRGLQLECARVFHESFPVPVLTYGCKTMIWREKERSRFWAIQMDKLRGFAEYQENG